MLDEPEPEEPPYTPLPAREWLTGAQWGAVVAVGAALVAASFIRYGSGAQAVIGAIFCPSLTLLSAIDLRHRLLPSRIIWPAAGGVLIALAVGERHHLVSHVIAGIAIFSVLFVMSLVTQSSGGMGMGDAKLTFLIGLALGIVQTVLGFILVAPLVIALTIGLYFRRLYRIKVRRVPAETLPTALKTPISYGPILALGALIAYFTG